MIKAKNKAAQALGKLSAQKRQDKPDFSKMGQKSADGRKGLGADYYRALALKRWAKKEHTAEVDFTPVRDKMRRDRVVNNPDISED